MLPMSLASEEAKQMQQQSKHELAITMSLSSSGGPSAGSQSATGNSVLSIGPRKEEIRFVPLTGSKSCNITISKIHPGTTTGVHHQFQTALKSKLTAVNVVPKTLKTGTVTAGGSTTGSAPLFQLVPSPNNPRQNMVTILAPPRKSTGGAVPSNAQPVVIRSGPALNKAQLTIHNGIATMTTTAAAAAPAGAAAGVASSRSLLVKSELPQKAASVTAGGAGAISLLANPIKPRAPLILSKGAVDKLQLQFNKLKTNPNAIVLGKGGQVKKVMPLTRGSSISSFRSSRDAQDKDKSINDVSLLDEELPKAMPISLNNNDSKTKSLITPKSSSIKALPLSSNQDIITVPAFESMEEKMAMPHLKSVHNTFSTLELMLNGTLKMTQSESKDAPRETKTPPTVQESVEEKTLSKQQKQAEVINPKPLGERKPELCKEPKETPKPPQPDTKKTPKPPQHESKEPPKSPQKEPKEQPKPPQKEPKETPKTSQPEPKETPELPQHEPKETAKPTQPEPKENSKPKQHEAKKTPKLRQSESQETPKLRQSESQENPKPRQPEPKETPTPRQPEPKETPKPPQPETKVTPQLQLSKSKDSLKSSKLRSKSFTGEALVASCSERRHSVAIMAKEVDVIEAPSTPIETITIEDDDDDVDSEVELYQNDIILPILPAGITVSATRKSGARSQLVRKNSSVTSRKTSYTASSSTSSSDVEEICTSAKIKNIEKELSLLPGISIVKAESLNVSKESFERSLRCDEQLPNTPPSCGASSSMGSDTASPSKPAVELTVTSIPGQASRSGAPRINSLKKSMVKNLSMLRWRGQHPAKLQNSSMCFELNRFSLLQINERCEQRQGPAAYFERALVDRPGRRPTGSIHPLLYLCQRCNCHGPAADFLAPHYCSVCCVRRAQKRRQPHSNSHQSRGKIEKHQANSKHQQQPEKSLIDELLQRPKDKEKDRTRKPFRWSEYLKGTGRDAAAPIHLFLNPFPLNANCFETGMKLEAIDPENCSLFCVCSIAEMRGYRLKLTFDGYSSMYDFWVNADSEDIFPPGWCDETGRVLQAPKDYCPERFSWRRYLVKTNAKAAPRALFKHLIMPQQQTGISNKFEAGMHLEAEDLNDTGKICVATVADILDERVRVHFDGWDDCYDLWVHVSSPYIHPCGWHKNRQQLIVPPDYQSSVFNWGDYIAQVGGVAAPENLFKPRQPMEYQARMKLEVVDQRNPCLIRPATVVTRKGYRVQLHLDCWPTEYYFWLEDDSPDLHPIGWCEATSHDLETPPGYLQPKPLMPCDVEGCRGFGNAKQFNLSVHALRDCCPYALENWRQWRSKTVKPARVAADKIRRVVTVKRARKAPSPDAQQPAMKEELPRVKPEAKAGRKRTTTTPPPGTRERKEKKLKLDVAKTNEEKQKPDVPCARTLDIAKSILNDYGPQFRQNYRLWQQNSALNQDQIRSNPLHWTSWDVYEFMERAMESKEIAQAIFEEDIDGRALLMMGRKEIEQHLKLKVGPAVKLFSLIVNLRIAVVCKFQTNSTGIAINRSKMEKAKKPTTPPLAPPPPPPPPPPPAREQARSNGWSTTAHIQEDSVSCDDYDGDDDDDMMLDSEDFLNVKTSGARRRLVIDEDDDVVMIPQLDVRRPMTTAS